MASAVLDSPFDAGQNSGLISGSRKYLSGTRIERMATISAGILMYRQGDGGLVVLLVHPGGPFWRNRDLGAWSIPKGELDGGEATEAAARREFKEELGIEATGPLHPLGSIRQRSGKIVEAFALEGDLDVNSVRSNDIAIAWPPRSGRVIRAPEIDRAEWFDLPLARKKILAGQRPLLDRLEMLIENGPPADRAGARPTGSRRKSRS